MLEDPRPIPLTLEPLDDFIVVETTEEEAETRAVSIQSGRFSGTRFCQITSPPTPSGWRFSWHGRSNSPRTIPSPTATK